MKAEMKWWWGALKLRGRKRFATLTRRFSRHGFLESFVSQPES